MKIATLKSDLIQSQVQCNNKHSLFACSNLRITSHVIVRGDLWGKARQCRAKLSRGQCDYVTHAHRLLSQILHTFRTSPFPQSTSVSRERRALESGPLTTHSILSVFGGFTIKTFHKITFDCVDIQRRVT